MKDTNKRRYLIFLTAVVIILFVFNLANRVNSYNATILAFSYKYGFISRGFIGSLYQVVDCLLPIDMYSYSCVNAFVIIVTVIFCITFICFSRYVLCKAYDREMSLHADKTYQASNWRASWYLVTFTAIVIVPSFSAYYNFGRVDMYLVMITMLAAVLLISKKCEWLIVPLVAIGVMVHEGYVFLYLSVIVVIMLYEIITAASCGNNKRAIYLAIILGCSLLGAAVLFIYFMFFSHDVRSGAYDEIVAKASAITHNNKYHKDLIRAEILGVDLTSEESKYRLQNVIELIILLIMMIPFIIILIRFLKKVLKSCSAALERVRYILVIIGVVSTLPLYLLKVDYGRWTLAAISYYCLVIMVLMAMGDDRVISAFDDTIYGVYNNWICSKLLLGYMLMIVPFTDVAISKVTYMIYTYPDKFIKMLGGGV